MKKINPLLSSSANEDFTDANKQLFGPGLNSASRRARRQLKLLDRLLKLENLFFEGWPLVVSHAHISNHSARHRVDQICSTGKGEREPELHLRDFTPTVSVDQIQPTVNLSGPNNLPQGMFFYFLHLLNQQQGSPLTGRLKYFHPIWEGII